MEETNQQDQRTFREVYDGIPDTVRADISNSRAAFVDRIAAVTLKSRRAVINWIYGYNVPDELTKTAISRELGIDADYLFPRDGGR